MPSTPHNPTSPPTTDWDEVLYQNDRTQIYRRHFAGVSSGVTEKGAVGNIRSIICKRPLGSKASVRLQHERRILERLAGIPGMQQLATTATPPSGVIALEDRQLLSLTDAFPDKPLPLTELVALALQLADLIAALHRAGIVHKDLSPANIVFGGAEQTPSLIDFDLATTFAEERPGFIQPQDIAGTLAYMSPEQTGRTGRPVDHRTDLYALGAILYELALGHPPFDNNYSDPLHRSPPLTWICASPRPSPTSSCACSRKNPIGATKAPKV
jgi:serine/threonine protein kinase